MSVLQVTLIAARGLILDTKEGVYDPGYTIRLGRTKYMSPNPKFPAPKAKNTHPTWQKTWTFNISGTLAKQVTIKVVDFLDDGAQVDIGDVQLSLQELIPDQEQTRWYKLENSAGGEIQVSMVIRDEQPFSQQSAALQYSFMSPRARPQSSLPQLLPAPSIPPPIPMPTPSIPLSLSSSSNPILPPISQPLPQQIPMLNQPSLMQQHGLLPPQPLAPVRSASKKKPESRSDQPLVNLNPFAPTSPSHPNPVLGISGTSPSPTTGIQNPFQVHNNPFLQPVQQAQQPAIPQSPLHLMQHQQQFPQTPSQPIPALKQSSPAIRGILTKNQGHVYQGTLGPFQPPRLVMAPRRLVNYSNEDIKREDVPFSRGAFSQVFRGKVTGIPSVVCIKDTETRDQKAIDDWKKEVSLMSQNRSPYIAEVYGFASNKSSLTIIMEYFPLGDLFGILHKKSSEHKLSLLQRMRMARHCALGVLVLHNNNILHRDIKSMNILVTEDYACKLADFGCSKMIEQNSLLMTMGTGTPLWMAPEVPSGNYSLPSDIYSLGLVLYELFEKKLPEFNTVSKIAVLPASFNSSSCILPLVNPNPALRPSASKTVKALDGAIRRTVQAVYNTLPTDIRKKKFMDEVDMPESFEQDKLELYLLQLYQYLLSTPSEEADTLIESAFARQGIVHEQEKKKNKSQNQQQSQTQTAQQSLSTSPQTQAPVQQLSQPPQPSQNLPQSHIQSHIQSQTSQQQPQNSQQNVLANNYKENAKLRKSSPNLRQSTANVPLASNISSNTTSTSVSIANLVSAGTIQQSSIVASSPAKSPRIKYAKLPELDEDVPGEVSRVSDDSGSEEVNDSEKLELSTMLDHEWASDDSSDDNTNGSNGTTGDTQPSSPRKKTRKRSKSGLRNKLFGKSSGKKTRKSSPPKNKKKSASTENVASLAEGTKPKGYSDE